MLLFDRIRMIFSPNEEDDTDRSVSDRRIAGSRGDRPRGQSWPDPSPPSWRRARGSCGTGVIGFGGPSPVQRGTYSLSPSSMSGNAPSAGLPSGRAGRRAGDRDKQLSGSTLLGGDDSDNFNHRLF